MKINKLYKTLLVSRDNIYYDGEFYYSDNGPFYTLDLMSPNIGKVKILCRIKEISENANSLLTMHKWDRRFEFENLGSSDSIIDKIKIFKNSFLLTLKNGIRSDNIIVRMFSFEALGGSFAAALFFRKKYILAIHGCFEESFKLLSSRKYNNFSINLINFFAYFYIKFLSKCARRIVTSGHELPKHYGILNYHPFMDSGVEEIVFSDNRKMKSLVYVGEFSERKGIEILLNAISNMPHYNLTLIGKKNDYLELVLNKYEDIKNRVEILGFIPYGKLLFNEIGKHSALILPSIGSEGWSRVITEANSVGVPTIVSDVNGLTQAVSEFASGMTFRVGDAQDLVEKINYMHSNQSLYEMLSKNSIYRAEKYKFENEKKRFEDYIINE